VELCQPTSSDAKLTDCCYGSFAAVTESRMDCLIEVPNGQAPRSLEVEASTLCATLMFVQGMRMPSTSRAPVELEHSSERRLPQAIRSAMDAEVVKVPMGGS
jgi:hypothetical protein